jgi:hypothetical protein
MDKENDMKKLETAAAAAPQTPGDAIMVLATAATLDQFKESRWYKSAPSHARATDPAIEIVGIEHRQVFASVGGGLGGSMSESKPFLIGRTQLGGLHAKLALRLDFGIGGFVVLEGEE